MNQKKNIPKNEAENRLRTARSQAFERAKEIVADIRKQRYALREQAREQARDRSGRQQDRGGRQQQRGLRTMNNADRGL